MNYSVMVILGVITACACGVILSPIAARGHRALMALCLIIIPLAALGAYLGIGQPDKAGAYAALDAPDSRGARKREMLARVNKLERAIEAETAPASQKLIELGTLRQRLGRHKQAIAAFERANAQGDHYATLLRKLGKAYFRAGLKAMRNGRRDKAGDYWQKALTVAPRDAPYLTVIDRAVNKLIDQGKAGN